MSIKSQYPGFCTKVSLEQLKNQQMGKKGKLCCTKLRKNKYILCIDRSSDAVIQYSYKIIHTKMLSSL